MRIRTNDGRTHPAILTTHHLTTGHGTPIIILTDINREVDCYGWVFCVLVSSSDQERTALCKAGYPC